MPSTLALQKFKLFKKKYQFLNWKGKPVELKKISGGSYETVWKENGEEFYMDYLRVQGACVGKVDDGILLKQINVYSLESVSGISNDSDWSMYRKFRFDTEVARNKNRKVILFLDNASVHTFFACEEISEELKHKKIILAKKYDLSDTTTRCRNCAECESCVSQISSYPLDAQNEGRYECRSLSPH